MSELIPRADYLARALNVEADLLDLGALAGKYTEELCPVKHSWGDGCYIREWNSPAEIVVVSKIHKIAHPFFVLKGDISVLTENGVERITAPHYGITPPGTKRILYTHAPTQWITVHVTNERDLDKIEAEIIAPDASTLDLTEADMDRLQELIK